MSRSAQRRLMTTDPQLVYGCMTGWGQNGPLANSAGHDINYVAIIGALSAIGTREGCNDPAKWRELSEQIATLFASRSHAKWRALLEGTDACFAPVLTQEEAAQHPHMQQRRVYCDIDGVLHAAPAPRFSRTPGAVRESVQDTIDWG
ncbi:hypothetical protein C1896_12375 [Pseudomonadaceae bacterium SI-3]|nr:hypothetical protein C1896_12375 [Pseudomonadaceae bacterium SI-3]